MNEEIYIVFRDAESVFLQRFLKKNFSHVFVLKRTKYGWIEIDATISQLKVCVLQYAVEDDVARAYKKVFNARVLKLKDINDKKLKYHFYRIAACVGIVQYVINSRFFVLTPWQLYKKLLKNNYAEEI